ncbi:glycosyltransferase [Labrys sp. LIt4]|nr:glycosyltransferase [Labrys sp. LIt4]MBP0581175.1 glycosyltransferase [Labrys sp. LIt4]
MTVPRTVLIVSPYFPPSNLACVHRARHLANHLPAAGWTPIILCVDDRFYEQDPDPLLGSLVSPELEIVRVPALQARMTRRFGIGDLSLRAWSALSSRAADLLSARRIDTVLITGSPFYPMLMSRWIEPKFGVPVVLDFQDPWVSAWGRDQKPLSKAGLSHQLALRLEGPALRKARFVTSVSTRQNEELAARHSWLDASRMAALPIGGDPGDLDLLRAMPDIRRSRLDPAMINLSYVGTALPRSQGLFRVLFKGLAEMRARQPGLAARLRLHFIGTSNQANDSETFSILPLAEAEGVADLVAEIPRRLAYAEALGLMAGSHGLLLVGSDEAHYTASKIYPALLTKRPYLSLFHRLSGAHALLAAAGGGIHFSFTDANGLAGLPQDIATGLERLALDPASLGQSRQDRLEPFSARAIAGRYAAIFDGLR